MRHLLRLLSGLALALVVGAPAAVAQSPNYPSRPIRIIVPSAASGAGDLIARYIGDALSRALHTPVVIENRPGGSGVIGNEFAAHAAPDGYTLLFATSATHIIASHAIANLRYDPLRDFTPVINIAYATSVVVVSSALPVTTLGELIAFAKERPRKLNYASSGVGSANHVDTEVFAALAGIELTHIPYRGTADGYQALLKDEVQLMFGAITSALAYIEAGRLRPLAVLVDRRSPLLPGVPTIAQAGLPGVDVRKWLGLVAPAGTPPEIVARVNASLDAILHLPSSRAWLERQGLELAGGSPAEFDVVLHADDAKWAATLRRLGLAAE